MRILLYVFIILSGRFSFKLNFIPWWNSTLVSSRMKLTCKQKFFHPGTSFILGWDFISVTCKRTFKTQKRRCKNKWHREWVSNFLSGILQGSILGPILFNIFKNDFKNYFYLLKTLNLKILKRQYRRYSTEVVQKK